MKNIYKIFLVTLILLFSNKLFAKDVPVIVISPGKSIQSSSTVGTNVTVISGDTIRKSNEIFLGDIIDGNSSSTNTFQMGGSGTNMGIQLRGLEKRYSTVYVDGIKMSDPGTPDNGFYFQHIMKESIDRVEILKGNQSTLYGPNAVGGTIHLFTKKGKEGHHTNSKVTTGSNRTLNVYHSVDGARDKIDYFLGLNRHKTAGISARNDDGESDKYRNENLNANFGYQINENLRIENSIGYTNHDLKFDAVSKSSVDNVDREDGVMGNYALQLKYNKGKFNNHLTYNKMYSQRNVNETAGTFQNYFGFRDAFNFTGTYNFNLDNRLVYGAEAEFDAARYDSDYSNPASPFNQLYFDRPSNEHIFSQFFDYQFRPLENLYTTVGLRSDEHSNAGRKTSGRTTLAYKLDDRSTVRSSWGSGIRFPSLYDYHYANGNVNTSGAGFYAGDGYKGLAAEDLNSERANSYDIGYETFLDNLDLGLNVTYFNVEVKNPLNGDSRNNWKIMNTMEVNTSEGLELALDWKPEKKKYTVGFDYTYTYSYDANTCYDGCSIQDDIGDDKVRVPLNTFSSTIAHNTLPNLTNSLKIKFVDEMRDFGDGNNSFTDVVLDDYITFDFSSKFSLFDGYGVFFHAKNVFDENYEQAHGYSSMGRSFNIGLNRIY